MIKYITDEGIIMDSNDFVQFLEFKMTHDFCYSVEDWRLYLDSFDEFATDIEKWNVTKQILIKRLIFSK